MIGKIRNRDANYCGIWDAFLWLVAFAFIELNVFEWRQEDEQLAALAGHAPVS